MEESRFFNHVDSDRVYKAEDFAEYFSQVLTNGILNGGDNLYVFATGVDGNINIKPGKAWIQGYFYKNTDTLILPVSEAHGTYDRIDRVVLRLDTTTSSRYVKAFIKTGTPAMTPVAPELTRSGSIYEISLAAVTVTHNTTILMQSKIKDERLDISVCGLVNSLIQVDTGMMEQKFDNTMNSKVSEWDEQVQNDRSDWNEWYSQAKDDLLSIVPFDFDNLVCLDGAAKSTVTNTDGSITETIKNESNGSNIAMRETIFNSDGSIDITETVWNKDGTTIHRKNKIHTIFNVDGSITEEVSAV